MKLKTILDHLTFNELSQHRLGGYSLGNIQDVDIPKILTTINSGVEEINQRLNLLRDLVRVDLNSLQTTYTMAEQYAESSSSLKTKYIMTGSKSFTTKFRKFIGFTDSSGVALPLNVRESANTIAINSYDTFQVQNPKDGDFVWVEYEYDPESLVATTYISASNLEYPLPHYTANALYAYVGTAMEEGSNLERVLTKNQTVLTKFELEIKKLTDMNVMIGETMDLNKFTLNGWR